MSTVASTDGPSDQKKLTYFSLATAYILNCWTALSLAVENKWGGEDSDDKRDWLGGVIVDMFPDPTRGQLQGKRDVDVYEIEGVLTQVMAEEFETNLEDDSAYQVATDIVNSYKLCLRGDFAHVEILKTRFNNHVRNSTYLHGRESEEEVQVDQEDRDISESERASQEEAFMDIEKPLKLEPIAVNHDPFQIQRSSRWKREDDEDEEDEEEDEEMSDRNRAPRDEDLMDIERPLKPKPIVDDDGFQLVQRSGRRKR